MLREELKSIKADKKGLRKFGLTVGGVILLLSLFWWWRDGHWPVPLSSVGIILVGSGLIVPQALLFPHKIWMSAGVILGWFTTRIILSVIFYLIITPLGLIASLIGKKFLELDFRAQRKSYWNKREPVLDEKSRIRKQF